MKYPQENLKPYRVTEGKTKQMEKMFDRISHTYDSLNHLLSFGIDRHWRKKAINALQSHHPKQLLDVATGTGDLALLSCRLLFPSAVTCIDISEEMLELGARKARAAGYRYILRLKIYVKTRLNVNTILRFEKGNCEALNFKDESFDAVTVGFGVRNFENLDKGLSEMYRVLRQGGRMVILELSKPLYFPMRQLFALYAKTVIPLVGRWRSHDGNAYSYLPETIKAFPQGEVMQEIIRKAGFSQVEFKRLTFGLCTLYIAVK